MADQPHRSAAASASVSDPPLSSTAAASAATALAPTTSSDVPAKRSKSKQVRIGLYLLKGTLGSGSFGKVKLAEHLLTDAPIALKMLSRKAMAQAAAAEAEAAAQGPPSDTAARGGDAITVRDRLRREIELLAFLEHPNIVRLYDVLITQRSVVLVMRQAGRELFDYIVERGSLPEDEARQVFQQLIDAVAYMHRMHVVHRDLKPENVFIDERKRVRIGDFGFSTWISDGDFLRTCCGSPNYAAPEVIAGRRYAGPEVDIWSLGVILYVLLTGTLPFDDPDIPALYRKVTLGQFSIPSSIPAPAAHLIQRMLTVDPTQRATMTEIMADPWFNIDLPLGFQKDSHEPPAPLDMYATPQSGPYQWWSFSRTEADPRAEADAEAEAEGDDPKTAPPTPSVVATVPGGEPLLATLTSLPPFPPSAFPHVRQPQKRPEPDTCIVAKIASRLGVPAEAVSKRLRTAQGPGPNAPDQVVAAGSSNEASTIVPHHRPEVHSAPDSPMLPGVTDAELRTAYDIAYDRHEGYHPAIPSSTAPASPIVHTHQYHTPSDMVPAHPPPLPLHFSSLPPPLEEHQQQAQHPPPHLPPLGAPLAMTAPHSPSPGSPGMQSPYMSHALRTRSHTVMVARPQAPPGHPSYVWAQPTSERFHQGPRRSSHTGTRPNPRGAEGWIRDWDPRSESTPSSLGGQTTRTLASPLARISHTAAPSCRRGSAPNSGEISLPPTPGRRPSLAPTTEMKASRTEFQPGLAHGTAASSRAQSPLFRPPPPCQQPLKGPHLVPSSTLAPPTSDDLDTTGPTTLAMGSRTASVSGPGASPSASPAISPSRSRITSPKPDTSSPSSTSGSRSKSRGPSQGGFSQDRTSFSAASGLGYTPLGGSTGDEEEDDLASPAELATGIAVLETSLPTAPVYTGRGAEVEENAEEELDALDEHERRRRRRASRKKREREQRANAPHRRARWHYGIRSRSGPAAIVAQLYRSLAALRVEWHVSPLSHSGTSSYPSPPSNEGASFFSLETRWRAQGVGVRIDLQLYRVDWGQYLVDFRHIGYENLAGAGVGPKTVCSPYLFLECATQLISELSSG